MMTKIYTRKNIESDSVLEFGDDWNVSFSKKPKTLQYFITSRCNYRCPDCFFLDFLGNDEVEFSDYKKYVYDKVVNSGLEKVNILGGEPTLYRGLSDVVNFNHSLGLRTNVYSNGARLDSLKNIPESVKIRLSVLSYDSEKPITKIKTDLPLTIVYPLNNNNILDVEKVLKYCENLNVSEFVFSTIKKLESKNDFFENKNGCLSVDDYISFLNSFFLKEDFRIGEYHINSRGIFDLGNENLNCNFINKLVDGSEANCPFDIDIKNFSLKPISFESKCTKNDVCLLEKIVVKKY